MCVAVAWSAGRGCRRLKKKGKNEKRTKSDIGRPRTPQNHQYYIRYRNTNTPTHPPIQAPTHPFSTHPYHRPPPYVAAYVPYIPYIIIHHQIYTCIRFPSRGWVGRYLLALVIMVHDTGDKSIDACDNAY